MRERISVTLKTVGRRKWGDLSVIATSHDICGETVKEIDSKYNFAGGHRVRLYRFKKNVHWLIPEGVELDISGVPAGQQAPRRSQGR